MFGLFRRKKTKGDESGAMFSEPMPEQSANQQASQEQPEGLAKPAKALHIELSWKGLAGLFCLFFVLFIWIFLFGMWAGQVIVFPTTETALPSAKAVNKEAVAGDAKKEPVHTLSHNAEEEGELNQATVEGQGPESKP